MATTPHFLESTILLFHYYKKLGEGAIAQLEESDLQRTLDPESNSIAVLVKHLHGNMRSRFTDFLTTDGEKEWRERDAEFQDTLPTKEAVLQAWEAGWAVVFDTLDQLTPQQMETIVYIRNQGHTVLEALQRQLGHYSYHVGQIVYLAKHFKGEDWESLSIPKGKTAEYNAKKFASGKDREHFSKEWTREART